jgi:hypothetical protein
VLKIVSEEESDKVSSQINNKINSLEGEFKTNIQNYEFQMCSPILYGSSIQLLHVASQKYLTLIPTKTADIEHENLLIYLQDYGQESSHFRIQASFKYQISTNSAVRSGDKVYFEGYHSKMSRNIYLHASDSTYKIHTLRNSIQIYELNASLDAWTNWQIRTYSDVESSKNAILYGDSVWIRLAVENQVIGVKYNPLDFIHQAKVCLMNNLTSSNGLWIIEQLDMRTYGKVHAIQQVRIKHLYTGMYLSVILSPQDEGTDTLFEYSLSLSEARDENSIWKLVPVPDSEDGLAYDKDFYILINISSDKTIGVYKEDTYAQETSLKLQEQSSPEHYSVFLIKKADRLVVSNSIFLRDCFSVLRSFPEKYDRYRSYILPSSSKMKEFDKTMSNTLDAINLLNQYCQNKLPSMISLDKQYGEVQIFRQNILRELCFIEILVMTLDGIFREENVRASVTNLVRRMTADVHMGYSDEESVVLSEEFVGKEYVVRQFRKNLLNFTTEIGEEIYKLIRIICKNNTSNQEIAFEYFGVFMKHAVCGIGATECMLSIIQDNEALLYSVVKIDDSQRSSGDIIPSIISLLNQYNFNRMPDLLLFLSQMCSYKGVGLTANQLKIFECLIKNRDNFEKILIPMNIFTRPVLYPDTSHINTAHFEEVDLKLFFRRNLSTSANNIEYMQNQLRLFADLCMGRNIVCMDVVKDWFPIEQLVNFLFKEKLPISLRAVIAQLILNLYIDTYPRFEIEKPELIKILKFSLKKRAYPYNDVYSIAEFGQSESYLINLITKVYTDFSNKHRSGSPSHFKKVTLWLPSNEIVEIKDEELPVYLLSDYIIEYLMSSDIEYDQFTYEIIKIVKKMIQLEIYGVHCITLHQNNIFPQTKFKSKAMGIIKISKALMSLSINTTKAERLTVIEAPIMNSMKDSSSFIDQPRKENDSSHNSILLNATKLRNYIYSLTNQLKEDSTSLNYQNKCKEEILSVMNLYLNWRIEFLIYNVIEWFNRKDSAEMINDSELIQLLPPIMPRGRKLQDLGIFPEDTYEAEHRFKSLYYPEIPDLSKVCDSPIAPLFLKAFVKNHDPHIQSEFLRILLRCHSQRSEMIDAIQKLYIITDQEEANLYAWTKLNSIRFKDMCSASEIWISSWSDQSMLNKESMMFEASLEMIKIFRGLLRKDSWIVNGEPHIGNEEISSKRQLLLFYIGVHKSIIQLIKDGIQELKVFDERIQCEIDKPRLHSLFLNCFLLLSEMTSGNSKIQKEMKNYIPIIISYLKVDVNQIDFYCSIYRDNLFLCSSIKDSELLTYYNYIFQETKQIRFLKLFKTIMLVKGRALPTVQAQVLNLFISQNTDFLVYLSLESGKFKQRSLSKEAALMKRSFFKENQESSYYEYHAELLNVLSMCCYGINKLSLNEAKCQKIIKIKYLFFLLEECENEHSRIRILRIPLLNFLYNVYIDVEKKYDSLKSHPSLVRYIETCNRYVTEIIEFDEDYKEFLDIWLIILDAYIDSFVIKQDIRYSNEDYIAVRDYICHLNEKLNILPFELSAQSNHCLNKLLIYFNIRILSIQTEYKSIEDSPRSASQSSDSESAEELDRWEEVRSRFSTITGSIWKEVTKEKHQLKYIIYHLGEYSEGLTFERFLRTLVNFLRHSKSQNLPNDIIIKTLRLLSDIVSKPLERINETGENAKKRVQNLLVEYGAGKVALSLMCIPDIDIELFEACVSFAVDLLEEGNDQLQREFYHFFINVTTSEMLLSKMNDILHSHIEKTYDFFDDDPEQIVLYQKNQVLVCSIIRFLQLLCENHNLDLQNYLRYQEKSSVNYNMLAITINLLSALMHSNRGSSFLVMNQCFDTITEFMQGPCTENQKEVLDSKFLDITSALLGINNELSHRYSALYRSRNDLKRGLNPSTDVLETSMISHLKYKTLITLHALVEGRIEDFIISRLMRALSLDVFKENLVSIYQSYKEVWGVKYYESDIFNNYIPTQVIRDAKDTSQIHYSHKPIVEIGFLLYFFVKNFQLDQDPEVQEIVNSLLPEPVIKKERAVGLGLSIKKAPTLNQSLYGSRKNTIQFIPNESEKLWKETVDFFENHTGHVEIVLRNGTLIRAYYPLPPSYFSLTPHIQRKFIHKADRTTFRTKLQYLMKETPRYMEEIKHQHRLNKLYKTSKVLNFIAKRNQLWKDLAFINCLIINFLIIASYSVYKTHRIKDPSLFYHASGDHSGLSVDDTEDLIYVLGAFQCVFAFKIVMFYLIKAVPVEGKRGWNKVQVHKGHTKQPFLALCIQQGIRLIIAIKYVLNPNVVFYVLYMIMAIFGLAVHPFFFACHLFEILYRFPVLQNVVKSVSVPRKALFLTFILMLVTVYIFGLLGYYWIYKYFHGMCPSLWICSLSVFDRGFKASGGIGGWFESVNNEDEMNTSEDGKDTIYEPVDDTYMDGVIPSGDIRPVRFFYDNIYNIIVIIMLLNIVQGIIIDTFVVLRLRSEEDERDKKNVCFICNIDRDSMEIRTSENFVKHRLHDHNEWSYIFYLDYILEKNPVDYTGIESYVRKMYDMNDISWFPHKRALALKETFESDDDAMKQKQYDFELKVVQLEKLIDELIRTG